MQCNTKLNNEFNTVISPGILVLVFVRTVVDRMQRGRGGEDYKREPVIGIQRKITGQAQDCRQTDRQFNRQTSRQANRQADKLTGKQTRRQTDRQTD